MNKINEMGDDEYVGIYCGPTIRHAKNELTGEYIAEKSSSNLVVQIIKREKADLSNLQYLGKKDGVGMDWFIEHHAINLFDLGDEKFIFVTGENDEKH